MEATAAPGARRRNSKGPNVLLDGPSFRPLPFEEGALWQMNLRSCEEMESGFYPVREGEPDCAYYIKTGLCRFGATCRFNHPPNRQLAIATATMRGEYPERTGQPDCEFYLKTGTCKFGMTCKFNHPRDKAGVTGRVPLNKLGYPLRPNESECSYYLRTGECKFGSTCKFHHPEPSSNTTVSSHGSSVHPPVRSPSTPGQQSHLGILASWPLSRSSLIPSPRGPSSYPPLVLPKGVMSIPGLSAYRVQLRSATSEGQQQQTPNSGKTHGSSRPSELTSAVSQRISSPLHSGSLGYALRKESAFPQRPGQPECQFYMKTGDCKFGAACKFHHPREKQASKPEDVLSPIGLPLRSGAPLCIFYSRYGICKFGPSCKFDHPIGVFTSNFALSSADTPLVRRLLASSSGVAALAPSSAALPKAGGSATNPRRLSRPEYRQMSSGEAKIKTDR